NYDEPEMFTGTAISGEITLPLRMPPLSDPLGVFDGAVPLAVGPARSVGSDSPSEAEFPITDTELSEIFTGTVISGEI
ncbi:hypothetical protein, partial [Arthrobacter sp. Br18]|uniref:hypothetical protein n=1 Tax=Arthrobacter sp. Br18 TaxID=1312954 RepID=UPI001C1E124B